MRGIQYAETVMRIEIAVIAG